MGSFVQRIISLSHCLYDVTHEDCNKYITDNSVFTYGVQMLMNNFADLG